MAADYIVFAGTANPPLAAAVAANLETHLGEREIERFPDGELTVRLGSSVRDRLVFIVQPTSPPVNDHLVELLAFADACRRASASRITAVVPYFGYARGDRRSAPREPIMASLVAQVMQCAGIHHLVLLDVHTPQLEGFFRIPVDHLSAVPAFCDSIGDQLPGGAVVVSPDAGRIQMAREYARRLNAPLAILLKHRKSAIQTETIQLIGDVRDRVCLIIDDMIATGGTILESVRALREAGARPEFYVAATHGLLLGTACAQFAGAGVHTLFVTDSVLPPDACGLRLQVTTVAPLIASAIRHQVAAMIAHS
jgi:ribose-phosphate pyrophosphokinase